MTRKPWLLVIIVVALHALAQVLSVFLDSDAPLEVAVVASGLLVFIWLLLWATTGPMPLPREAALRVAIAGAIVVEYLSLVGIVAFFKHGPQALPPIAQALISSFTTIVGVVVAFFFGASAYLQAKQPGSTHGQATPQAGTAERDPA